MKSIRELKGKKCIKDLKACLKDCEALMKTPVKVGEKMLHRLWVNDKLDNFSLSFREVWSLWLLCAVMQSAHNRIITFCEDDVRDGILVDLEADDWIPVENVATMDFPNTSFPKGEDRILHAIEIKRKKGKQYANGTVLIVFFDGAGEMYANRVAKAIHNTHGFEQVYLVGLINDQKGQQFSYSISELFEEDASIYRIDITPDFLSWHVAQIQQSMMEKT
jgi:hypothetical protein